MATDGSGNLIATNATIGAVDLSSWDSASYATTTDLAYEVSVSGSGVPTFTGAMTNALDANIALRSIAIGGNTTSGNATSTTTLALGGFTLKADAIGSGSPNSTPEFNLGTNDSNRGTVTANGISGGDLYLIHQRSNTSALGIFRVNSTIADNGGAVNVIFGGAASSFTINQSTTNTDKVFINASGGYGSNTTPSGGVLLAATANFSSASEINFGGGGLLRIQDANYTVAGSSAQTLSGGSNLGTLGNIYAATRTLTIGANGTFAPGNTGANSTFGLQFTSGKLAFTSGSKVKLDLGTVANSDKIVFIGTTAGDWLSNHANATLDLTPGSGLVVGGAEGAYSVFSNVTTAFVAPTALQVNGTTLAGGDYTYAASGNDYKVTLNKLTIGSDANLGTAPLSATANSLVLNTGTLASTAGLTMNSNRGIGLGSGSAGTINGTINTAASTTLTYGGIIANNGSSTGVLNKTGDGTLNLTSLTGNSYTGGTNLSAGTLVASNTSGSATGTGSLTVGGNGSSATPTLAGGGSISSSTTIAAAGTGVVGTHAVGVTGVDNGVGTQTFTSTLDYGSGSIFEWSLQAASVSDPGAVSNATTGSYDKVVASGVAGSVTGGSAVFKIVLGGNAFTDAFWSTNKTWSDIFSGTGAPSNLASIFTTFSGTNVKPDGTVTGNSGQFTFNGSSTLTWSAVPKPTSALAGLLVVAGLLRRRRLP